MPVTSPVPVDIIIFGGGAAGLWLLDELVRAGRQTLLLEAHDLGSGQTITSQGIIHGGLKYTLSGLFTPAARAIREMPVIWRRCLAGEIKPNLSNTRLRAEFCHLWRTASLKSRLAMIGARAGLRIAPVSLSREERPAILRHCPGVVARLDEQVIEPASFIADLSDQHVRRIVKIDAVNGLEFDCRGPGEVALVRLINPETGEPLDIVPGAVVFTAGAGNADLRRMAGLGDHGAQTRPLHMVMVRGQSLPILNGHCVDGSTTRVTITSTRDFADRIVWQIGGQIAESGVRLQPDHLIEHAQRELRQVLPGFAMDHRFEWATYRADRSEAATRGGARPHEPHAQREGNTITAWPTKLALAPEMARRVMALMERPQSESPKSKESGGPAPLDVGDLDFGLFRTWPRPVIALPPWEIHEQWRLGD